MILKKNIIIYIFKKKLLKLNDNSNITLKKSINLLEKKYINLDEKK